MYMVAGKLLDYTLSLRDAVTLDKCATISKRLQAFDRELSRDIAVLTPSKTFYSEW